VTLISKLKSLKKSNLHTTPFSFYGRFFLKLKQKSLNIKVTLLSMGKEIIKTVIAMIQLNTFFPVRRRPKSDAKNRTEIERWVYNEKFR